MKKLLFIFLALILPSLMCVSAQAGIEKLKDCADKRIGVLAGAINDAYLKEMFPNNDLQYFTNVSDEVAALLNGRIDTFSCDMLTARALMGEHPEFHYLDETLFDIPTAYAFAKSDDGAALRDQMNAYLSKLESDGTLGKLQDKWLGVGAGDYDLDLSGLDPNGRALVFGTSCSGKPNSYYFNNKPTGYELELAVMFCREYGYDLDIRVTDFAALVPGVVSGKFDFANDGIAVTEERAQSVNFSDYDFVTGAVMVVMDRPASVQDKAQITSLEQLDRKGVKLGIVTGMAFEDIYAQITPNAELCYFNTSSDVIYALQAGQIDGYLEDGPIAEYCKNITPGLECLEIPQIETYETAFVVSGSEIGQRLERELNEYIDEIKQDGTYDALHDRWFSGDESKTVVDFPTEGKNGTVRVATCSNTAPFTYIHDGKLVGLEMDILARFCRRNGYAMDVTDMDFGALLTSISSGRADIAASFITVTPERREAVNFTKPYMTSGVTMVIRGRTARKGFVKETIESFRRTFIREDRWKLIVQGIGTTALISVCAALLGTLLGFGLCLLRRTGKRVIFGITTVYIRLLQGTPLLVLLMILYYLVFAKTNLSGELVAIIAFALNFAAYTSEIFRSGIDAIDKGQTEGALALGYTKRQAFYGIVLPQAAQRFLPVYKGEFISMFKMTSIVGYIAVQDLTKMSDIIRSRTYEAFFPLISTALIYFALSSLLALLLKAIKVEPDRVNRKLKGVTLK